MKLDRALQLKILKELADGYPLRHDNREAVSALDGEEHMRYRANMAYLEGHQLLTTATRMSNGTIGRSLPMITAKGLDFLADDGGLSAILGVVTIKIHEDSIRAVLQSKVDELVDIPAEQRSAMSEAIRNLPAKSLQTLADKLIGLGVDHLPRHAPDFIAWLGHITEAARGLF